MPLTQGSVIRPWGLLGLAKHVDLGIKVQMDERRRRALIQMVEPFGLVDDVKNDAPSHFEPGRARIWQEKVVLVAQTTEKVTKGRKLVVKEKPPQFGTIYKVNVTVQRVTHTFYQAVPVTLANLSNENLPSCKDQPRPQRILLRLALIDALGLEDVPAKQWPADKTSEVRGFVDTVSGKAIILRGPLPLLPLGEVYEAGVGLFVPDIQVMKEVRDHVLNRAADEKLADLRVWTGQA